MILAYLPKQHLANLFSKALEDSCRKDRIWIPSYAEVYLVNLLTEKALEPPCDIVAKIKGLQAIMPKDPAGRFDHLKNMGDEIVYWTEYWSNRTPLKILSLAQEYYDSAASIGKNEPEAPVLRHLAEKAPKYAPVLRQACIRLVA